MLQILMNASLEIFPVLTKRTALITKETLSVSALKDMKEMEKTIAVVSQYNLATYCSFCLLGEW